MPPERHVILNIVSGHPLEYASVQMSATGSGKYAGTPRVAIAKSVGRDVSAQTLNPFLLMHSLALRRRPI